jgi:hypothetical protein
MWWICWNLVHKKEELVLPEGSFGSRPCTHYIAKANLGYKKLSRAYSWDSTLSLLGCQVSYLLEYFREFENSMTVIVK